MIRYVVAKLDKAWFVHFLQPHEDGLDIVLVLAKAGFGNAFQGSASSLEAAHWQVREALGEDVLTASLDALRFHSGNLGR